jgi:hypothetical protein
MVPSLAARALRRALWPLASAGTALFPSPSGRKRATGISPPAAAPARPRFDPVLAVAASAPVCLAMILVAAFAVGEALGWTPLSYQPPANIAEAAALGLGAEVRRFMRAGQDPRGVYPLRADAISSSVRRATALEAAVWGRSARMLRMFDRMGLIDANTMHHLACLAEDVRSDDVRGTLQARDHSPCEPGAAYQRVEDRSQ